ncbi:cyclin-dependent kinase inhibitor 3-like [Salvia divinorum]|uniref:Cyclin-dependent kinase inhibitor 3-like n=1 Tax=Salvia divinorum TaxID=28513 RepID=A0ABD1GRS0_SALDI
MGKYMRKPKTTRDIDVSHSPLGVRTRARTLALQRLNSSAADYLQLRSRRLQKPPLLKQYLQDPPKTPSPPKQGFVCTDNENPQIGGATPEIPTSPIESAKGVSEWLSGSSRIADLEIEASFGENDLDTESRERCTRESTPCSVIRAADSTTAPGSSTKQRSPNVSNQMAENARINIPTAREMEEFFSHAEQPHMHLFMEKYNFDIVNDLPLPGRYEWVRVMP